MPFYANLDRVALELLQPGLAPTQRATIFWRRANDGRSRPLGFMLINILETNLTSATTRARWTRRSLLRSTCGRSSAGRASGRSCSETSSVMHLCGRRSTWPIEQMSDEGLRLLARAVPADQRKRFLEYRGDEFVRSLRLALERRDRVASTAKRLERQRDRRLRGRRRSSRGRTPRPRRRGYWLSPAVAAASRSPRGQTSPVVGAPIRSPPRGRTTTTTHAPGRGARAARVGPGITPAAN